MNLENQKIIIVGGSSGIGLEVAKQAAKENADVIIASRNPEKLSKAVNQIQGRVSSIVLDYLDRQSIEEAFEQIDGFDHLVLTAVANENSKRGKFVEMNLETSKSAFDKFWGFYNVLQYAVPKLNKKGSITITSGASAFKPPKGGGMALLAASNAASANLGLSLAVELAPIRVNVISPGAVNTAVWNEETRKNLVEWMKKDLPVQNVGNPEDIAEAYLFLMKNKYTTGVTLHIDGGLLIT